MLAPRLTRIAPLLACALLACRPKPVPVTEMPPREALGAWPCSAATIPVAVETQPDVPDVALRDFYEPPPAQSRPAKAPPVAKLGKIKLPAEPPLPVRAELPAIDLALRGVPEADLVPRVSEPARASVARWHALEADATEAQRARAEARDALEKCVAQSCGDASCIQLEGDRRTVVFDQLVLAIEAARAEIITTLGEREKAGPLPAPDALALEIARLAGPDGDPASVEAITRRLEDISRLLPAPDPLGWYALYYASQRSPNDERAVRLAEQLVDRDAAPALKAEAFYRLGDLEATRRGSARSYEKAFALIDKEKLDKPIAMATACKLAGAIPPRELPETSLRASARCAREMAGSGDRQLDVALAFRIAEALQTVGDGSPALTESIPTSLAGAVAVAVGNEALTRFNLREAERAFKLALQHGPSTVDGGIALAGLKRIAEERGNVAEAGSYATILDGTFGPAGSRGFAEPSVPKAVAPNTEGANQDLTRRTLALTQKCLGEVDVSSRFRLRFRFDASKPKPASAELEDGVAKELAVCVAARAPRFFVDAPQMVVRAQIER